MSVFLNCLGLGVAIGVVGGFGLAIVETWWESRKSRGGKGKPW